MKHIRPYVVVALAVGSLAACAPDTSTNPTTRTVRAGESIQDAVDAANPGDVIVVEPGVYHQDVLIETEGLVLTGTDQNTVILEGDNKLGSGVMVTADNVTVQNFTIQNFIANGVYFTGSSAADDIVPLSGFVISNITALDNGLYGLYSFFAQNGVIKDSYAAGHMDSGVYVGQCKPCAVAVTNVVAEYNAIGYEGTNGSEVYITNSVFSNNRIGITPNSQTREKLAPQGTTYIYGNTIANNNSVIAPEQASGGFGIGIAIGGGVANDVYGNNVTGNEFVGILVTSLDGFRPENNIIEGNRVLGNGTDLAFFTDSDETTTDGNCFLGNETSSTSPADLQTVTVCATNKVITAKRLLYPESPPQAGERPAPTPPTASAPIPTPGPVVAMVAPPKPERSKVTE